MVQFRLSMPRQDKGYDVVLSGGIPPNTYTIPITLTDLSVGIGSGGFPITLGLTSIGGSSTTTSVSGLTVDGVTPTVMGYVDPSSSIQTQLNGKQATLGFTPYNATNPADTSHLPSLRSTLSLEY